MTETPKHSVSVAGVVVNDAGQILVIQRRDNRHWEAPGGVLELSESFENGVRREVLEETGICITVGRLTGVYKNMRAGVVALVFRCTPALPYGDAQPQSAEAVAVRWVDLTEVLDLMDPAYAVRVTDAFSGSLEPATRVHDGVRLLTGHTVHPPQSKESSGRYA
jgi:8-oxo-dGTP diphosphatase